MQVVFSNLWEQLIDNQLISEEITFLENSTTLLLLLIFIFGNLLSIYFINKYKKTFNIRAVLLLLFITYLGTFCQLLALISRFNSQYFMAGLSQLISIVGLFILILLMTIESKPILKLAELSHDNNKNVIKLEKERDNLEKLLAERIEELTKVSQELQNEVAMGLMMEEVFIENEKALQLSQERLDSILGSLQDVVYSTSPENQQTLYLNSATEKVYDRNISEFISNPQLWLEVIFPEDYLMVKNAHENILTTEKEDLEYRILQPNGNIRWVQERSQVVCGANNTPLRIDNLVTDITERKKTEVKLKQANLELEASNRELEHFAYVASHDLQEPLRAISSYSQLLARRYKDKIDGKANKYIDNIADGVTRMQKLIDALLNYSRVSNQVREFQLVESELILKQALNNLQIKIKETQAKITSDSLPTIMGDEVLLIQLFQNLIGNALKFHGEKPPQITISVEQREQEWCFCICDHGIGIEAKYAQRIFQIFQRLHSSNKYPGTGIGLAICQKIVERHQGRIWLDSQLGEGSSFYFSLPLTTN